MHGLSLPPTRQKHAHAHTLRVEGEKGREGNAGSSMDHQDPTSPRRRLTHRGCLVGGGNVRGTLEGWGCYIRPARGGESSVHPRGAYRSRSIGHRIVAPGVDREHLALAGCTHAVIPYDPYVVDTNGKGTLEETRRLCC